MTDAINRSTGKPYRYRKGHWAKVNSRSRWPTREELELLLLEHGSTAAVAKHLRIAPRTLYSIVEKYGIDYTPHGNGMTPSTIRFGWSGEEHAALVLGGEIVRQPDNSDSPYDVAWQGQRVEVKTARPSKAGRPPSDGWTFKVKHNAGKHDAVFCIACAPDGMPVRYFLIPAADVTVTMIRIPVTLRSKWAKYQWSPAQVVTVAT